MGHRTSKDLYRALGRRLDQAPVRTPWTPVFHDLVRALYTLSLADLVIRRPALERAYNPNDCPELRWGAPGGSDELRTCTRRAPRDQQQRMEAYRAWFREPTPPARRD